MSLNRVDEVLLADAMSAKKSVGAESKDDLLAFVRRQAVDAQAVVDNGPCAVGRTHAAAAAGMERGGSALRCRREKFIALVDSTPPPSIILSRLAPVAQKLATEPAK